MLNVGLLYYDSLMLNTDVHYWCEWESYNFCYQASQVTQLWGLATWEVARQGELYSAQ